LVDADRAQGFRTVLVTGELDFAVGPIARYFGFDAVIANSLLYRQGSATGGVNPPLIAEKEKAAAIRTMCFGTNADLGRSKAYSDSISDVHMLEAVGQPAAVNPDRRLKRIALRRGWSVLDLKNGNTRRQL
jgi:phosphoserine phosphatase